MTAELTPSAQNLPKLLRLNQHITDRKLGGIALHEFGSSFRIFPFSNQLYQLACLH